MNNEISSSGNVQAADGRAERPPLRTVAELPDGVAPPEVPADYIVTPLGYYPPESVHKIGLDEMSADTVQLRPAEKDKGQSVNKGRLIL